MAIVATTLAGAMTAADTFVNLTSATGVTAPNFQTGAGITYLYVDQELMLVNSISGTIAQVVRGFSGTQSLAHVVGAQVQIGISSDFPPFFNLASKLIQGIGGPAATFQPAIFLTGLADAISPSVPGFYVIKSAAADLMTLAAPTAAQEGNIISIYSDVAFAHTLTATALLANGTALKTTATYAAFRGAGLQLRACNLVWHVLANTVVVLT